MRLHPDAEQYRAQTSVLMSTQRSDQFGWFLIPIRFNDNRGIHVLRVMVAPPGDEGGDGWDHVSVSLEDRTPSWEEMCFVKNLFFAPEETVVQFHPKASAYVNVHPHCLHLWRRCGSEYDLPPKWMIG